MAMPAEYQLSPQAAKFLSMIAFPPKHQIGQNHGILSYETAPAGSSSGCLFYNSTGKKSIRDFGGRRILRLFSPVNHRKGPVMMKSHHLNEALHGITTDFRYHFGR
jgi:hypothetical protein